MNGSPRRGSWRSGRAPGHSLANWLAQRRARQDSASIRRRAAAAPDLAIDRASDRVREAGAVRLSHRALRRFAVSRQGMAAGSDPGAAFERDDRRRLRAARRAARSPDGDRPAHRRLSRRRGFGGRHRHHERHAAGARSSGTRPAGAGRRDCRRRSGLRASETVVQDAGNSSARRTGGSRGAGRRRAAVRTSAPSTSRRPINIRSP